MSANGRIEAKVVYLALEFGLWYSIYSENIGDVAVNYFMGGMGRIACFGR